MLALGTGVIIRHGVDATALPSSLALDWKHVRHVVFNFPLAAGTAEHGDDTRNTQLLTQLFSALARLAFTYHQGLQVHLSLCLDQVSVRASHIFDTEDAVFAGGARC